MFHYVQFRPDKKEKWHLVDESQMDKQPELPAYISVLAVDKDVDAVIEAEGIALDEVRYRGPMYFDLDNADNIDAVLDSTRELLSKLKNIYEIPEEYIHCWLSGGKGVHITVPSEVFGVSKAVKHLPHIYKLLAEKVKVQDLDMSVYSASKGRLWRCEHVPRPGSGTYKVAVTVDELETMDAERYSEAVAHDRAPLPTPAPDGKTVFMKAQSAFKQARQDAARYVSALKKAKVIPKDKVRALEEVPGCIEKLIKVGDCAESTWNQASMQVAAWIATRYTQEEEEQYRAEVFEPFIENVQSSSRNEAERRKSLTAQISRAFHGRTRFLVGPLIAAIGESCHACPLCRGDIEFDAEGNAPDTEDRFDPLQGVKETSSGYQLIVNDKPRQVTTFTFKLDYELRELVTQDNGSELTESDRTAMVGTVYDRLGEVYYNVTIPEVAWTSRVAMNAAMSGKGSSRVVGNDTELTIVGLSVLAWQAEDQRNNGGGQVVTNTRVAGIHMDKVDGVVIPTYIEGSSSAYATTGENSKLQPSRFKFHGRENLCPKLMETSYPYENDTVLVDTLNAMFKINRPEHVARMVGWMAATFLKEHIRAVVPQFPLLGVWGNAGAGKTMSVMALINLTGIDYQSNGAALNAETTTAYPLFEYLSSSNTVPRLIEEVNESVMGRQLHQKLLGLFKAAWGDSGSSRGRMHNGSVEVDDRRVSAPIVYVAEQRSSRPALRNRTVEIMLTSRDREVEGRSTHFKYLWAHRTDLHRAAKAMLHRSLTLSINDVSEMLAANEHLVAESMDARPRFSMMVVLMGLDFLDRSLLECKVDVSAGIKELKDYLVAHLNKNQVAMDKESRITEVDQVLKVMDQMAADSKDTAGLIVREHYYRIGTKLFINMPMAHAKYRRWMRNMGDRPTINSPDQMISLLEGESFFDRTTEDDKTGVRMHVLDLHKLEQKGVSLKSFQEIDSD